MATIDGIVSGLDTKALIDSLISLQAGQQSLLVQKKSTATSLVTALQALNTKVASLAEHAAKVAKPASWQAVTAAVTQQGTTGPAGATATVGAGAQTGTLSLRVDAVAQSQASLLVLAGDDTPGPTTFTLTRGDETVTVTAASRSVPEIVEAFNASGTGVRATAVRVDVRDDAGRPTGETAYRVQLTGTQTGAGQAFTVAQDGAQLALDTVRTASDASLTLFPGSGAEQTLTSSSNTFTGVMTGVDVTVTAVTASGAAPLALDVTRDEAAVRALASGLVANLTTVLSEIGSRTKATTTTAADGGTILTGGLFAGDTSVRLLQQNLVAQASLPVNGVSPSDVGLVLSRDGSFTFDETLFTAALAKDPEKVAAVLQGVAARVAETADAASDATSGTIALAVRAQQDAVRDLGDRITDWDDRLAMRRLTLERTYAALETTLSGLQSQSSYLASYLTDSGSKS